MSEFKIEKGVPIPLKKSRLTKYPWKEMKVGNSFFVAASTPGRISSVCASRAKTHPGECYATRKEGDGVRVWRVK